MMYHLNIQDDNDDVSLQDKTNVGHNYGKRN